MRHQRRGPDRDRKRGPTIPWRCPLAGDIMRHLLLELELANDRDMIAARQRARQVSALLDFDAQDCPSRPRYPKWHATQSVTAVAGIEFALEEEGGHNPALSTSRRQGTRSPTSKQQSAAHAHWRTVLGL
jgi:hypothetical protein